MKAIIEKTRKDIEVIESILNPEFSILERCNTIIASVETECTPKYFYTVCTDNAKKCDVAINVLEPTQFESEAAQRIVEKFEATNGHGQIKWVAVSVKEYYSERLKQLKDSLIRFEQIGA